MSSKKLSNLLVLTMRIGGANNALDSSKSESPPSDGGFQNLKMPCTKSFCGVMSDPEPCWSLSDIVAELNALESKFSNPFIKRQQQIEMVEKSNIQGNIVSGKFVVDASDKGMDDIEDSCEVIDNGNTNVGSRFSCDDVYLSSDSEDECHDVDFQAREISLVNRTEAVKGYLLELEREEQLKVKEEIRDRIYSLNDYLRKEKERTTSSFACIQKDIEAKQEMDKKLDKQYQRKIAETCDIHLSAVQRDHEQRSEIEERKIRKEAASEDARRKEKMEREEKERLERLKAEAEARMKAEQMKAEKLAMERAAVEAQKRAEKEAAERAAEEALKKKAAEASQRKASEEKSRTGGVVVKVSDMASKLEQERMSKLLALVEQNKATGAGSSQAYRRHERQIRSLILQVSATVDVVRKKSLELVKTINDPFCPQSISVATFAEKAVSYCETQNMNMSNAFALGHVIVLVTSQVPAVMAIILAEFHKACIFTVPKHIVYSKSAFATKEAYYKMIGYKEDGGNIESTDSYLQRLEAYMTLYAALIQTEIPGIANQHGLKEGWAWLARFLNVIPADRTTATALVAFLRTAGHALYRRYGNQFIKILRVITRRFLPDLKGKEDPLASKVINNLETYLQSKEYLSEPKGLRFAQTVESKDFGF
ncbi:mRNA export factor GLE1 isoform X2 [Nymphaea colorata]|uniref:mRNA export factor GLE1 isoform X2 n=1 Tax=Nymphaea colorata TaxID=210225 RepID=UPI00129E174D|nr:mRNA export factor GLE1 isoform X2 [Nymphaea colorata]